MRKSCESFANRGIAILLTADMYARLLKRLDVGDARKKVQ